MTTISVPEELKVVLGYQPAIGTTATMVGDYISVKNLHKLYACVFYRQGDATDITFAVLRATAVAPTSSAVVATACRIWSNLDTATSDTLVERTAAINYAAGAGATNKIVIFEIDPADLGETGATPPVPYDVAAVQATTGPPVTSALCIVYIGIPRYPGRVLTAPTIITD